MEYKSFFPQSPEPSGSSDEILPRNTDVVPEESQNGSEQDIGEMVVGGEPVSESERTEKLHRVQQQLEHLRDLIREVKRPEPSSSMSEEQVEQALAELRSRIAQGPHEQASSVSEQDTDESQ